MHIGIDDQSGLIYEGLGNPELPVVPTPNVSQAKLIEAEEDWRSLPRGIVHTPMAWVFREDSFDATTRTRRGRLYFPSGQSQPSAQRVGPHPYDDPMRRAVGSDGRIVKSLYTYVACTPILDLPHQGQGATIALGSPRGSTAWRIIHVEVLANNCVLITLKALSAFGIVPELDIKKVDPEFATSVSQAVKRVIDSAFRETPISVVDHCRNALAVLLSCWLVQNKDHDRKVLHAELGPIATILQNKPYEMGCLANLASLVARLHSRGKGNEQQRLGLDAPVEDDAQLAIDALGFTLREIKWARI